MKRVSRYAALTVLVLALLGMAGIEAAAPQDTATFFIAHPDSHTEATSDQPLPARGSESVSFEVRVVGAGSAEKAAWQTVLQVDACEFETPASADIRLGDMFGGAVPVLEIRPVQANTLSIKLGQVFFVGSINADAGLLATVKLTPRTVRACPDGGTAGGRPDGLTEVRFAGAPTTQWSAPGGVKLPFQAHPGYLTRGPDAITLTQAKATTTAIGWPLLAVVLVALLTGAAVLAGRLVQRTRQ